MISERSASLITGLVFAFVVPVSVVWGLDELGTWAPSHAVAFWAGITMTFGMELLRPEIRRLSPYHEVNGP